MKKNFFYEYKTTAKNKVLIGELRRAHLIIAMLAISLAFLIAMLSIFPLQVDELLAGVAAALLIIVAAVSLSITLMMKKK